MPRPAAVVSAAADGERQLVLAREARSPRDVVRDVAQRAISAGRLSIIAL